MTTLSSTAWSIPCLRIGHGGASGHAPANTLRSLEVALELGVDMVEFDVRACRDALVLLHDDTLPRADGTLAAVADLTLAELRELRPAPQHRIPTLEEALDLLRGQALLNVDLKGEGYEEAVVEQIQARAMTGDVLYSSLYPASLRRVRQAQPQARTGFSYPEDKGGASSKPCLKPVVSAVLAAMRLTMPCRVLGMIAAAQADAAMLYQRVLSRQTVEVVHRAGHRVYAWTVDDPARLRVVHFLGVDGIASNYPDRFAGLW